MITLLVVAILALTNVALLVGIFLHFKEDTKREVANAQERKRYMNALISRNASEMRDLELTDKVEEIEVPEMPKLTEISDLDDSEFDKMILEETDGSA